LKNTVGMFDEATVKRMVSSTTWQRGSRYYLEGRVELLPVDQPFEVARARVKGSGRKHYTTSVFILDNGELEGECSCPVEHDCKHAVATALEWLEVAENQGIDDSGMYPAEWELVEQASSDWQAWFADMPESEGTDSSAELQRKNYYLLYSLSLDAQGNPVISLRKGYLKLDGGWSQIKPFQPDVYGLSWNPPSFLLPVDIAILKGVLHSRKQRGAICLEGAAGAETLALMLTTGRLTWQDDLTPLHTSAERSLQWQWQAFEDHSVLCPSVQGLQQVAILDLSPLYYYDPAQNGVGLLTSELPVAQCQHLFRMPPVPASKLPVVALQLRQIFDEQYLPLPVEPDMKEASTPVPRVRLMVVVNEYGARFPGLLASFDYGDCHVVPDYDCMLVEGQVLHLQMDDQLWAIRRDLPEELKQLQRLQAVGMELHESLLGQSDIWMPCADHGRAAALDIWQSLLDEHLPAWQQEGWQVDIDPDYTFKLDRSQVIVNLNDGDSGWFDFALRLPVGERMLGTQQLVEGWLEGGQPDQLALAMEDGWVQVDTRPLQPLFNLLLELYQQEQLDGPVSLPPFQAAQLTDVALDSLDERSAPLTRQLIQQLKDFKGLEAVPAPEGLQATLRDYQQQGLNWLCFLQQYGFGGILADDMGLGKTLQALTLLLHIKQSGQAGEPGAKAPAMVLAPTSLMGNWVREAEQFAPQLKVCLIHGPNRAEQFSRLSDSDLVITSYPLLLRDFEQYAEVNFSVLILDEAQAIKNPNSRTAQQVRKLSSAMRLCLTGTPLENHLGELWSLMDFVLPGLLGGQKQFQQRWRKPIEQEGETERQQALGQLVAPFMLRRTKAEVVAELPPKSEIVKYVELAGKQRELYEAIRLSMEKRIRELVASQGMARSHIEFLDALLKLRQACIDPRLVKLEQAQGITQSAKLDWLTETLPEMVEEGRRLLIFSQFTQLLGLVEPILKQHKIGYSKLTGQTRKRQQAIDAFQQGDVPVFLISLKAGGSGLNLTAADTVIHLDPWWNPAVEQQATDRAYRIGQDKPVFVYKLVTADTVEERILQLQQQKQALADSLFAASGSTAMPTDGEQLLALLSSSNTLESL